MTTTSRHRPALVELSDPRATASTLVGSKAATLAVLARSGFPVPSGWVITTSVTSDPGPTKVDPDAPLARDVAQALDEVTRAAQGQALAVRSSATAEDLPDASFAGQYDTTLAVRGRDDLERAVRATLRSVDSDRVASYAGKRMTAAPVMAVLVQPMVPADAAGVAFTADPVTGDREHVVVNAVAGLADALVSGTQTPETWLVSTAGEATAQSELGALEADQARQVADLARRVEDHLGAPQDIEWAIAQGTVHLLQARPITNLPEAPVAPIPIPIQVPPGSWEHDASHFPLPNYPIDRTMVPLLEQAIRVWVDEFGYLFDGLELQEIGGWMYERLRPMGGKEGPELPTWVMWLAVRSIPAIRRRLQTARVAVTSDKAGRFIHQWYDAWLPELSDQSRALLSVDLSELDDAALDVHLGRTRALLYRGLEVHALVHGSLAPILYELATFCERAMGWDLGQTMRLVSGTSFKSTEPARALHALAQRARIHPAVLEPSTAGEHLIDRLRGTDAEFAAAFEDYVQRYCHRSSGDSVAVPSIAEHPDLVLALIRDQVRQDFDPVAVDAANAEAREVATAEARQGLARNSDQLAEFERLLDRARLAYPAREDNEFYCLSSPYAVLRYALLEVGDRLNARGVIEERDHVMFLELDEALQALAAPSDQAALVARRRGEFAWARANRGPLSYGKPTPPPATLSFLPADARLPMQSMLWSLDSIMAIGGSHREHTEHVLAGTPASAGTYTGPVRVILGQEHFSRIRAGDVLVCPITSPVWSVLFPSIGAIVTDTGGVLSHPAIIAREYGIPAVVATRNATDLLSDGQIVTVDGAAGTIRSETGAPGVESGPPSAESAGVAQVEGSAS